MIRKDFEEQQFVKFRGENEEIRNLAKCLYTVEYGVGNISASFLERLEHLSGLHNFDGDRFGGTVHKDFGIRNRELIYGTNGRNEIYWKILKGDLEKAINLHEYLFEGLFAITYYPEDRTIHLEGGEEQIKIMAQCFDDVLWDGLAQEQNPNYLDNLPDDLYCGHDRMCVSRDHEYRLSKTHIDYIADSDIMFEGLVIPKFEKILSLYNKRMNLKMLLDLDSGSMFLNSALKELSDE